MYLKKLNVVSICCSFLLLSTAYGRPPAPNTDGTFTIPCEIPASKSPPSFLNFAPNWGKIIVGVIASGTYKGRRFVQNEMKWTTATNLKWFKETYDSTYEPDTSFYDSATQPAYGTKISGPWNSNLPKAYLDTQTSDFYTSPDAQNVTIGTSQASALVVGQRYYTWGILTNGRPKQAAPYRVKLLAQRGRRYPENVFASTWSVYSCDTANNALLSAYKSPRSAVPGCTSYGNATCP